jgi:hypothetical protein
VLQIVIIMSAAAYTKATTKTPPIHVLRGMLRLLRTPDFPKEHLRATATKNDSSETDEAAAAAAANTKTSSGRRLNETQQMLMDQYRLSKTTMQKNDELHFKQLRLMAVHYHNLKVDLAERSRLYKLDTGAEKQLGGREMSRRAAARAGLQMPKLNPDLK